MTICCESKPYISEPTVDELSGAITGESGIMDLPKIVDMPDAPCKTAEGMKAKEEQCGKNYDDKVKELQRAADYFIENHREQSGLGAGFGYNPQSLKWVDNYIRQYFAGRLLPSDELFNGMVHLVGAYFGECLITVYGGKWEKSEKDWGININNSCTFFPFAKVAKHFIYGAENSIYSAFRMIPALCREDGAQGSECGTPYTHTICSKSEGNPPKYEYLASLGPYEWTPDVNKAHEFSTCAEAEEELDRIQPLVPDRTLMLCVLDTTTYKDIKFSDLLEGKL